MNSAHADRATVHKEIGLIVAEALREGDTLRPEYSARIVADAYRDSGFEAGAIAEMIRRKAVLAGVKVAAPEISEHQS